MYASEMIPELVPIECPDRRSRCRMEHREAVQIDGRLVMGRDISSTGLSVIMREPLAVGDQVRVTLAGTAGDSEARDRRSRRARREARPPRHRGPAVHSINPRHTLTHGPSL